DGFVMAAAHDRNDGTHQAHLEALPFAPGAVGGGGSGSTEGERTELEEVGAGDFGIGQAGRFGLAGAAANGADENVGVGQVIGDEIREPVGQVFFVGLIGLDRGVNLGEIADAFV